ncbi:MAG: hypothetical protein HZB26_20635 [Candidatus Hydrogenedentes bacterium]|nr:hypothetical protein [Candidatus Hydrogenedentota bacterium]
MKKLTILAAIVTLGMAFAFSSGTAHAVPYVKGDPPQIEKERQEVGVSHANNATEGTGQAFAQRPSLGVENGAGAVTLAPERPDRTPDSGAATGAGASTASSAKRPNYGIENGDGAYK